MAEYSNSVMESKNVNELRNKLDAKLTDLLNMYNIVKALGQPHYWCAVQMHNPKIYIPKMKIEIILVDYCKILYLRVL